MMEYDWISLGIAAADSTGRRMRPNAAAAQPACAEFPAARRGVGSRVHGRIARSPSWGSSRRTSRNIWTGPRSSSGPAPTPWSLTQGDRWGQRLQGDITRVLAENLRGLLPSDNVFVLPLRRREPVAMTVAVDITSFERDASGAVVLNAYWTVLDGQTEAERAGARARYTEPVAGEGVEETVAAMNRTLAALSRDIAAGIKRASSRKQS